MDATLTLSKPLRALRVPAGAVFGISGSDGCIVPESGKTKGKPMSVSIVGSELGVSLITSDSADISAISTIRIGSGLDALRCG